MARGSRYSQLMVASHLGPPRWKTISPGAGVAGGSKGYEKWNRKVEGERVEGGGGG